MSWFSSITSAIGIETEEQPNEAEEQSETKQLDSTSDAGIKEAEHDLTKGGDAGESLWGFASKFAATVKEKSNQFSDAIKKDMNEFSSALTQETSEVKKEIQELKEQRRVAWEAEVKARRDRGEKEPDFEEWLDSQLDQLGKNVEEGLGQVAQNLEKATGKVMNSALTILPAVFGMTGEDGEPLGSISAGGSSSVSTFQQELDLLQCDKTTYTSDPGEEYSVAFQAVRKDFQERNETFWSEEVTKFLTVEAVAQLYDQLVPDSVAEEDFWCRYIFYRQCLQERDEKRRKLVMRLDEQNKEEDDDDLTWDDDDDSTVATNPVPAQKSYPEPSGSGQVQEEQDQVPTKPRESPATNGTNEVKDDPAASTSTNAASQSAKGVISSPEPNSSASSAPAPTSPVLPPETSPASTPPTTTTAPSRDSSWEDLHNQKGKADKKPATPTPTPAAIQPIVAASESKPETAAPENKTSIDDDSDWDKWD